MWVISDFELDPLFPRGRGSSVSLSLNRLDKGVLGTGENCGEGCHMVGLR